MKWQFELTTVQKGLLLVLLPFGLNLILLVLLVISLSNAANLAELERHESVLQEHFNTLIQDYYEANSEIATYLVTNEPVRRQRALTSMEDFKATLLTIRSETRLAPNQERFLTALNDVFDKTYAEIKNNNNTFQDPDAIWSMVRNRKQLARIIRKSLEDKSSLNSFFLPQKAKLDELRLQETRNRNAVKNVVIVGVSANLLVAVILVFVFGREFAHRFSRLVENANNLSKRKSLGEMISGRDELFQLDRALHNAADEIQQAAEFRQSLMQMVAHDLRSPLQATQLTLENLISQEQNNLSEKASTKVQSVLSNNRRLLALVADLLTLDSLESGKLELKLEVFPLSELVDESIQTLSSLATSKQIEISNLSENHQVRGDRNRISQVLTNYLSNAIKFSPRKSTIEVNSREVSRSQLLVTVKDSGPGMNAADAEHIFDKYYQAASEYKNEGFGLGLAICKLIITAHGGDVGVTTVLKEGSSFWFKINKA